MCSSRWPGRSAAPALGLEVPTPILFAADSGKGTRLRKGTLLSSVQLPKFTGSLRTCRQGCSGVVTPSWQGPLPQPWLSTLLACLLQE